MRATRRFVAPLILCVIFFSCSSDDDDSPPEETFTELIGSWRLEELNVSPPQDVDNDGTASSNLIEELDCISGTLIFNGDRTWSLSSTGLNIISITGDLFDINCAPLPVSAAGTWQASGNQVTLFQGGTTFLYTLSDDRLTNTIGEDLPNIRSEVYQKQ